MEWKVKYVDASAALLKEFRKAKFRALRRLGFKVMRRAQASIHDEKGPSEPGTPPHTHPGENTLGGSKKGSSRSRSSTTPRNRAPRVLMP